MLSGLIEGYLKNKGKNTEEKSLPIEELIEKINQKNKEFYDDPGHHKNVLKIFIPYEKPANAITCIEKGRTYNKEYVEEKLNILIEHMKNNHQFSKGYIERTKEGIYCAFLLNKDYIEICAGVMRPIYDLAKMYSKEKNIDIDLAIEKVEELYNKKWHFAKATRIRLSELWYLWRNTNNYFKIDNKDINMLPILTYGESNVGTYNDQQIFNKHLNKWSPLPLIALEKQFEKEDYLIVNNDNLEKEETFQLI